MKKFICLIILALTTSIAFAQVQQGRVKTRGRLTSDGKVITGNDIPDATITLGDGSTFKSGSNGRFSFAVTKGNYYLKNVQKKDYQLCDRDLLGRTKKYSSNVLEIAMQTPDEALEDRLESEEKIRATLNRQLSKQKAELKRLKEELKISQQEYNKKLQELYAAQSNNEKLISEMAERYSTIDFDQKDDFQRRVAAFIQNGELTRADSLLKTKGSMEERSAELDRLHTANVEKRETLEKSESMEATLLEDFAADCYSYYEMCKLQHKNDSAAYWLELRASKDTTNVEWQLVLGVFIDDYLADYDKALICYHIALRNAIEQYGEEHPDVTTSYNNIGLAYSHLGEYAKALEYLYKTLEIEKKIYGEEHHEIATTYNNISFVYSKLGEFVRVLEYILKAFEIQVKIYGEENLNIATTYNNIGNACYIQGKYGDALEYFTKTLEIHKKIFGEEHPGVATSYNNIGGVYDRQGDYANALEYYNKALEIGKKIFGEEHPDVATSYNNIGLLYSNCGEYGKALDCYNKVLEIYKKIFGEEHTNVAICYNNIGLLYLNRGDYDKALEWYSKALEIRKKIFGEEHPFMAAIYDNIGTALSRQRDYVNALEYLSKALEIHKKIFGEEHPDVATNYNNLGIVYTDQGDYNKALNCYNKALEIYKKIFGEEHPDVATSYNNIGIVYTYQGNYAKALEYYTKALEIRKRLLGEEHPYVALLYSNISIIYEEAKQNNVDLAGFEDFISNTVSIATIVGDGTPAKQVGWYGEYVVFEFGDWNVSMPYSVMKKNEELRGKPKTVVVMKDGTILQHRFENSIGAQLGVKYVGKQEKQRIIQQYQDWKKKQ